MKHPFADQALNVSRETFHNLVEGQIQSIFCTKLEISRAREKIHIFLQEFLKWGNKINITSKMDIKNSFFHHLYDSLSIIPYLTKNGNLMDIGSGNGFPAIPISIAIPEVNVFAIESNEKKAIFIKNIKNINNINNLTVSNHRFELKPNELFEKFDQFTVKAVKITPSFVQNLLFYSKNKASFFVFNSIDTNELGLINKGLEKVIHTVDKIVYNNFLGEKKEITKLSIKKNS